MRRNWGQNLFTWIIIALLLVGIISKLSSPSFYVPILIFALIYYFYKHPEKILNLTRKSSKNNYRRHNRRKTSFKIVNGGKDDYKDDRPKYH